MISLLRDAWRDALAVVFPIDCAGCGAPDRALCAACFRLLRGAGERTLSEQFLPDSTRVVSALRYERQVRSLILGLKERGRTDVVRALAVPLREAIEAAVVGIAPGVELCTIPSSRSSRRRRGYRPVDALTRAAGFRFAAVLSYSGAIQEQKALDRAQRAANLHGALVAKPAARGRRFVIVDDVVTSGATLLEAARALRDAGAEAVSAATLAFTPRRFLPSSTFLAQARDLHRNGSYGG